MKTRTYRGVNYSVQKGGGLTVYQGYDSHGIRVIYALSKVEFERKADAWVDQGKSQYHTTAEGKRSYAAVKRAKAKGQI